MAFNDIYPLAHTGHSVSSDDLIKNPQIHESTQEEEDTAYMVTYLAIHNDHTSNRYDSDSETFEELYLKTEFTNESQGLQMYELVDPQDSNIIDLDQMISDDDEDDMIDGKEQEACHQHEMHQLLLRDFFNIPVQPEIEDVELNEADLALLAEILDIGTWFGGQPDDLMEDLSPSLDESLDMDNDIEDDL